MAKINLEKLIADFYNSDKLFTEEEKRKIKKKLELGYVMFPFLSILKVALKNQGLEYKDGEIQRIPFKEKQKAHIDEGLKNGSMARECDLLHPDDWYECICSFLDEYGYPSFVIGEFANLGKILKMGVKEEQLKDYFKPCTECIRLSFPVNSQVFVKPLKIIGTVVKTYKEGCVVKEIGLQQFHDYNDLEPIIKLKNTDTIKFNEPDSKKHKFVDLNKSEPIPITRMLWRLYASSHSDSSHQHSEELLLFLLTKGCQRYQEELRQQQYIASEHKECPLSSIFERDVKALQEDLRYILDVNWNPECDYNYPKK